MPGRPSRRQRDHPRGNRCHEEDHGERKQDAQAPVRSGKCGTAFLRELALESIQSSVATGGVGPLERRREASTAVELAPLAARVIPLARGLRQMLVNAPAVGVVVEPRRKPRPVLQESLVYELDGPVVCDQQPTLDQLCEDMRHALVVVGVEFRARHAPARGGLALAAGHQPEQDPPCDLLLLLAEGMERRLGVAADCAAHTAGPLVLFVDNKQSQIYVIHPDGTGLKQLTYFKRGSIVTSSSFSPDGKWIVFGTSGVGGNADLFVMKPDGTTSHSITRTKLWDSAPDWGPAP